MPSSPFTTRFGLALPIVQGPMTGSDTPALAAAVSQAGGLGMLGCGMRSPAAMAEVAAEVRRRTDRPFGMNLFVQATPTPTPDEATVQAALQRLAPFYAEFGLVPERPARWCEDFGAQFEALVAARPAVASFTFGILSAAQVARLQATGSTVVGTATTVAEARAWAAVGADAVCASGMESGGHRGTFLSPGHEAPPPGGPSVDDFEASMLGTLTLVRQCVDALPSIPVIAAGGIMDGRGIAGALALGAQAVQMGTAFLTCPESGIGPAYRQALTQAGPTDTRTTRIFSGRPARGIVNTMMDGLRADERSVPPYPVQNALTGALRRAAAQAGRADHLSLWAGQGVAQVRPLPAAELMALLAQELQAASA
ncbi:nitronate monooxygenase family protein [Acidovorax sp. FJL06]|uniref:NAD(P)H-dependent flavin oxidoreductase n=1 Tax=Acidovorax sp. FJL06 TaxID=2153365 RepID=UPI000F55D6E0|nr:nitronate monooxygenase family protein [Acidovorax sp. FJL06]RQO81661.1 nitronate monooxygenase [Acidovorax sp. FJL06]